MFPRTEMLDLVVDERPRGRHRRARPRSPARSRRTRRTRSILATGGYGNVFYLSTNAKGCNVTATYRAYKRGAGFANPCFTQIHPTCIPVSRRLPVEADADVASRCATTAASGCRRARTTSRKHPDQIAEDDRDYYLERKYPSFGNLSPRDIAIRAAKEQCDDGRGVGPGGRGVYLDFRDAIKRDGEDTIREKYGNLFDMYERITGENPYQRADAHLPGRPLHDGRPVGRLPPADDDPRPVLPRRGELLRPRREPPRRLAR